MTEISEKWYKKAWRPTCAFVYLTIVIFDFIIMPSIIEMNNNKETNIIAVELALRFENPSAQVQALAIFTQRREWKPLSLGGSGMLHLAFGAILTGAAVTRGLEKRAHADNGTFMT